MHVRLGIGTYTFTWTVGVTGRHPARPLSAHDLVGRAAAARLDCVQIEDNMPLDVLSQAELRALFPRPLFP